MQNIRLQMIRPALIASLTLLVVGSAARAGGWALFVDLPRPGDDPARQQALRDVVVTVTAAGCHGPGTSLTGVAEGVMAGKRTKIPLHLVELPKMSPDSRVPVFGVRREWPTEGRWVLALTAHNRFVIYGKDGKPTGETRPLIMNTLVPIGEDGMPATRATPGGKYERVVKSVPIFGNAIGKTVESLLQTPTEKTTVAQNH